MRKRPVCEGGGAQLLLHSWGRCPRRMTLSPYPSLAPCLGRSLHHPPVFSFESRLKPEKNEEKKRRSQKLKHSPCGGELEGPLQVAQAWQLVLGLWKPLTEAKIQEASPSTHRACGSVELGHQCQLTALILTAHRGSAQWLFLSASAHIQSGSADPS